MEQRHVAATAALYTQLPYPGDGVVRTTSARILLKGLRQHAPALLERRPLWIADVGCGTGEATAGIAKMLPGARVVGIDVNRASLDLARALAARSRLNLTYVEANAASPLREALQRSGAWPPEGKFDLVTSMGVLHHLSDPATGFAHVRDILREDGLFQVYVYSKLGRREVLAVRDLLDHADPGATFAERARMVSALRLSSKHTLLDGLRTLRKRLRFGPPLRIGEIVKVALRRNRVTHASDTFSNPCEHSFLFEELFTIFARTGWAFAGLAKRGGLPTSPEEHTRDPRALEMLKAMPQAALFDLLAFAHRVAGWTFFLRPTKIVA
ncbi:MAG: Trans-aconitate 2-methyltransferase [Phycisphaerae bacterium]|nr:Trans-aconitate 2-methyltransferase [Phycisphaerae bacterium]